MLIVFGSINMDIIVHATNFIPETHTSLGGDYRVLDGGKGANQAIASVFAGASKVYMVGCVGHDRYGDDCLHNMRVKNVVTTGVARSDLSTGLVVMCVDEDDNKQINIVANGANVETKSDQIPDSFFKEDTVVLLQMEVPHEENWSVVKRAHEKGSTVILNVAPAASVPEEILSMVDYLIVNKEEAGALASLLDIQENKTAELVLRLSKKYDLTTILTMSEKGTYASEKGMNFIRAHAMSVNAVDTTGAGDTFCGVFAACIERGMNVKSALHHASVGGALACMKEGAQESMPTLRDIEVNLSKCEDPEVVEHNQ